MEQVFRGLQNILIYIDNILVHTDSHEKHLQVLEQVLLRLHKNPLKINLDKCLLSDDRVSYLGFTLTPQGIKPGEAKLRAIKNTAAPSDIKSIWSFVGLCNFFRNHIWKFAITTAPLFKLTHQDSGYTSGPFPEPAFQAFKTLKQQLCQEPTLAFPRTDWPYLRITNAYKPTQDLPGGLCTALVQNDKNCKTHIISHVSRQLKGNEKNCSPLLLEILASVWGMVNFNKYLKGSQFSLYADPIAALYLNTMQMKLLNQLRTAMMDHSLVTWNQKLSHLPTESKKAQKQLTLYADPTPAKISNFNSKIHAEIFKRPNQDDSMILSITDANTKHSITTTIAHDNIQMIATNLHNHWFSTFGLPA